MPYISIEDDKSKTPADLLGDLGNHKEQLMADLIVLARTYGWSGDYVEVCDFVRWCHDTLGVSTLALNLTPFDDE